MTTERNGNRGNGYTSIKMAIIRVLIVSICGFLCATIGLFFALSFLLEVTGWGMELFWSFFGTEYHSAPGGIMEKTYDCLYGDNRVPFFKVTAIIGTVLGAIVGFLAKPDVKTISK